LRKNLLVSLEKRFDDLCTFIRLSTILHTNIGLSVFDPKYEIKCKLKYELSLLNSFAFVKENETKETDENALNKKNI
jgi:hypothetical protein